jgi:hypothetical protein
MGHSAVERDTMQEHGLGFSPGEHRVAEGEDGFIGSVVAGSRACPEICEPYSCD